MSGEMPTLISLILSILLATSFHLSNVAILNTGTGPDSGAEAYGPAKDKPGHEAGTPNGMGSLANAVLKMPSDDRYTLLPPHVGCTMHTLKGATLLN